MVCAVVVAAGKAERMRGRDKLMLSLAGRPALARCLHSFEASPCIDGICLVTAPDKVEDCHELALRWNITKLISVVPGGDSRGKSVYNGLKALPDSCEIVAIQDGARPFTDAGTIARSVESARARGSGVAAIRSRDTVKFAEPSGQVLSTPNRSALWQVQTPQTFRYPLILGAYEAALAAGSEATDDAGVAEMAGEQVWLTEGSADNIKLTTPEDIALGEAIARGRDGGAGPSVRVGEGYDVHRLTPGRKLVLGGVCIPHETGLLGHSDADVLVHAVMDALLGAAGLGDIGRHFPDSDGAYEGISSLILLKRVADLLDREGWATGNVDATVAAQRPKLAPHIPEMRANIAECLGIDMSRVNIKATTTEGLGFEGGEEGMSARAVALIVR